MSLVTVSDRNGSDVIAEARQALDEQLKRQREGLPEVESLPPMEEFCEEREEQCRRNLEARIQKRAEREARLAERRKFWNEGKLSPAALCPVVDEPLVDEDFPADIKWTDNVVPVTADDLLEAFALDEVRWTLSEVAMA